MRFDKRFAVAGAAGLLIVLGGVYLLATSGAAADAPPAGSAPVAPSGPPALDLNDSQMNAITVEAASEHVFPVEKEAFGNIDFNEDLAVQVFTPYQGRIIEAFAKLGDEVKKGHTLFTIESPDLIQAESTLIAAAGVCELTTKALDRAKALYATQGLAQKDLEQAVSDQQTAEGSLRAARDAVRIFGKSDADMDRMVVDRKVDQVLVVPSPVDGRVTARNAQPGLLVQPGNPPAPYTVADLSTVWMLANVPEVDSAAFRVGQTVKVSVMAYPGHIFEGRISRLATAVDPNIHRLLVRSEVADPQHELRPGMFASFVIDTGDPVKGIAVPWDAVVREGDGTMTVWATKDRHHFVQRVVKVGLQKDDYDQIVDGLKVGELVATKGALLLDNILNGGPS